MAKQTKTELLKKARALKGLPLVSATNTDEMMADIIRHLTAIKVYNTQPLVKDSIDVNRKALVGDDARAVAASFNDTAYTLREYANLLNDMADAYDDKAAEIKGESR